MVSRKSSQNGSPSKSHKKREVLSRNGYAQLPGTGGGNGLWNATIEDGNNFRMSKRTQEVSEKNDGERSIPVNNGWKKS